MRKENCLPVVFACALFGCGDLVDAPSLETSSPEREASLDAVEIVRGVADRGRTPAVVAVLIGGEGLCSGTLIAPNVVLTARHCVAKTSEAVECPASTPARMTERVPRTLSVLVGDTVAKGAWVAAGEELFTPDALSLCDADLALLVLDRAVPGVTPLGVRKRGVALGERIRAVGFGKKGDLGGAGEKVLRDYVPVEAVSKAEFLVAEATCQGDSGGPAIDMTTGEIVGVVSRGGPSCEGPNVHNVYTRVDAFLPLVDRALARAKDLLKSAPKSDAGVASTAPSPKPAPDVGESCSAADDCAAGVCVHAASGSYCSRPCGEGLRCPTHFHCGKVSDKSVCLAVAY